MNKTTITYGVLLIAGAALFGVLAYTFRAQPEPPKFSYDGSKVSGWKGSENINLQTVAGSNYQGKEPVDKLPVADLTVHHGESSTDIPDDNCFVMFSYFDYLLDDAGEAYKKYEDSKKHQGSLTVLKPQKARIATYEGVKEFDMRRYDFTVGSDDDSALAGYQIGFIPLAGGYIRTEGVCKTADDLHLISSVVDAVELLER